MGDRRMTEIQTEDGSLYLYSHWGGTEMPDDAIAAIIHSRERWHDQSYAVAMMLDKFNVSGIMLKPNSEDEYNDDTPSIVIDLNGKRLTIVDTNQPEKNSDRSFDEIAGEN